MDILDKEEKYIEFLKADLKYEHQKFDDAAEIQDKMEMLIYEERIRLIKSEFEEFGYSKEKIEKIAII